MSFTVGCLSCVIRYLDGVKSMIGCCYILVIFIQGEYVIILSLMSCLINTVIDL